MRQRKYFRLTEAQEIRLLNPSPATSKNSVLIDAVEFGMPRLLFGTTAAESTGEGVRTGGTTRDAPQLARSLPCLSASRESLRQPQTFNRRRTSPYGPCSRKGSGFSQTGPSPQDNARNTHCPAMAGENARSVGHRARKVPGTRWPGPAFFGLKSGHFA